MANMTLRLEESEEAILEIAMKRLNESTKSKTLVKMLRSHIHLKDQLSEFVERSRKAEYELDQLKRAVLELKRQETRIMELVSD